MSTERKFNPYDILRIGNKLPLKRLENFMLFNKNIRYGFPLKPTSDIHTSKVADEELRQLKEQKKADHLAQEHDRPASNDPA